MPTANTLGIEAVGAVSMSVIAGLTIVVLVLSIWMVWKGPPPPRWPPG